jgi:oligopeptide/dipeptide ABC transporter ATP-binding protein
MSAGGNGQLLSVAGLQVWFPVKQGILALTRGWVRAVDGVSFDLAPGESLGVVGESGCGKSTLARSLVRLETVRAGAIRFKGRDLVAARGGELAAARREMQMVFQDPFASLNPRMTVVEIVTEGLVEHGLIRRRERTDAAAALLAEVGVGPEALHRFAHEFSGGQRQRISLARALSMRPSLVLCDEPVSALDVSVQAQVINLLMDLRERHGLAYLFISHDLSVVRHVTQRVLVMYMGQVVESGPASDVFDRPAHPYTRALASAVMRPGAPRGRRMVLAGDVPSPLSPPSGCRFHTRCPFAQPRCRTEMQDLEAFAGRQVACWRKFEICAQAMNSMVRNSRSTRRTR